MKEVKVYPFQNSARTGSFSVAEKVKKFDDVNPKEEVHYPCLCEAIKLVTFWCRLVGILPIVADKPERHAHSCTFKVSKIYMAFSYLLQFFYILYILITYISRFACGPGEDSNGLEW